MWFTNHRQNYELSEFEKLLLSKIYQNYFLSERIYSFHAQFKVNRLASLMEKEKIISNQDGIKLWDEGFVYYFKNYLNDFKINFPDEVNDILKKRIIINLTDKPENIYKKIIFRKNKTKRLHINHKINVRQYIINRLNDNLKENNNFVETFKNQYPNQTFTFDVSEDYEYKFKELCDFLDIKIRSD